MEVTFADGSTERYDDTAFARGAQGTLYRSADQRHVVKLYAQKAATPNRARAVDLMIGQYNVVNGDPYWDALFSWPERRVTSPSLGVRMRNVVGLTSLDHFFFRPSFDQLSAEKRGWWIGRVACAIKLARAVNLLSERGLCHSDLSERNVMVDAFDGRMTVLDCDSIVVPGVLPPDVLGTSEYMAPELYSRKVMEPTVVTDRHALAVLLYRWLLYRHPLQGPKIHSTSSDEDDRLAYGENALFIEHPFDQSNRPTSMPLSADMLTPTVRDLFHKVFVEALHTPGKRPSARAWEDALVDMFDRIIPCDNPTCELRFFVARELGHQQCPLCQTHVRSLSTVPFLKLRHPVQEHGKWTVLDESRFPRYVVGWPDRALYVWHTDPASRTRPDAQGHKPDTRPQAQLRYDPGRRSWYLQNLLIDDMKAGIGDEASIQWKSVPLGGLLELKHGAHIWLGPENVGRRAFVEMRQV